MEEETLAYLIHRIELTPIKIHPYSHFHVEQIFPDAFYRELIENIPDISYFSQFESYPQRSSITLTKKTLERLPFPWFLFWYKFTTSIGTLNFKNVIFKKFQLPLKERFGEDLSQIKLGADISLFCDQPGYSIGPHTDHPSKILTLLFYLPISHNQKHLGTSIYTPKDRSVTYSGHKHYSFKDFDKLFTIPFVPNSVFGFLRSDYSFHGVEPINQQEKERISICYTLWEQK